MGRLQLVFLETLSEERDKYVWEDRDSRPWDEIIGRMYLLKDKTGRLKVGYPDSPPCCWSLEAASVSSHGFIWTSRQRSAETPSAD